MGGEEVEHAPVSIAIAMPDTVARQEHIRDIATPISNFSQGVSIA